MKKHARLFFLAATALTFSSCEKSDSMESMVTPSQSAVLYATNNSNGDISAYDLKSSNMITTTFATSSSAADGVYFDGSTGTLLQVSRSSKGIEGFKVNSSVSLGGILNVALDIDGSKDMESPREMAVSGNFYVVADNADVDKNTATSDGRLFIYQRNGNSFSLRNIITTDIKLWGITFIGNDLYAVADADNKLGVYTNFLSNTSNMTLTTSKKVAIEGIVRTHGLDYDASTDTMVLTDIGDATNTQSDGGFQVIAGFKSKFNSVSNSGTIAAKDMIRVSGPMSNLGNPVDVAYDGETKTVYIAEAGNGGGRILSYTNITANGDMAPKMNQSLAAASSVYLYKK